MIEQQESYRITKVEDKKQYYTQLVKMTYQGMR